MVSATRSSLTDRTAGTRAAIMETAERLFAEHGLSNVSSRGIAEAAGQRNVTAVSYHFGSRTELVRVIMERHGEQAELLRRRHLSLIGESTDIRDWVGCLVRPATEHLASLGVPSWNARFSAQVMTDPTMRLMISEEAVARPHLARILDGLGARLEHLPRHVRVARGAMARNVLVHTCAERERALAEGSATLHGSWDATADELTDAIVGLLSAPTTTSGTRERTNRS